MFANMTRSSLALAAALALGLALSGCAKNNADNLAAGAGSGYGAASGPGSVQEFNQTVGDRVFFTTDQTDCRRPRRPRSTSRPRGSISTTNTASPLRATPMSGARANIISRWARSARKRFAITSPPRASPPRA